MLFAALIFIGFIGFAIWNANQDYSDDSGVLYDRNGDIVTKETDFDALDIDDYDSEDLL